MSSFNQATIIGNLGADPDIRRTNAGDPVGNLRIATAERWTDKQSGEKREKTEWHNVTLWGPLADIAERYLSKGSKVFIQGRLETRKWSDRDGNDRYTTEIVCRGFDAKLVMLDGAKGGSAGEPSQQREPQGGRPSEDFSSGTLDDDIPFVSWG